jgi:hypothetical protein
MSLQVKMVRGIMRHKLLVRLVINYIMFFVTCDIYDVNIYLVRDVRCYSALTAIGGWMIRRTDPCGDPA